jgi:hypothetical protein
MGGRSLHGWSLAAWVVARCMVGRSLHGWSLAAWLVAVWMVARCMGGRSLHAFSPPSNPMQGIAFQFFAQSSSQKYFHSCHISYTCSFCVLSGPVFSVVVVCVFLSLQSVVFVFAFKSIRLESIALIN